MQSLGTDIILTKSIVRMNISSFTCVHKVMLIYLKAPVSKVNSMTVCENGMLPCLPCEQILKQLFVY